MLQDHELFTYLCKRRGITSIPEILQAMKVSSITGELRLNYLSIIIPVCEIIAQTLVSSCTIKTINLSECTLLSKGLGSILDALCKGTTVTTLNLRGNNVKGPAVAHLGKVFTCNNTLKQLHIEWNSIGLDIEPFITFCDGLAKNHNIEQLDLRFNQLSPSCAEYLCKIIRENRSLRSIDLSWNTLGQQGCRMLLNAMHENQIITKLLLHGNSMPKDVAFAIEERLQENRIRDTSELVLSTNRRIIRSSKTTRKIEFASPVLYASGGDASPQIQKLKSPMSQRMGKVEIRAPHLSANISEANDRFSSSIENSEANVDVATFEDYERIDSNIRANTSPSNHDVGATETNVKITDLGKILQERTATIELLTGEIATKVTEVNNMQAQLDLLQTQINQLQNDKEKYDSNKEREIAELRKSHDRIEENWRRDYKDLKNSYNECSRGKKKAELKMSRYEGEMNKALFNIDLLENKIVTIKQSYEDKLLKNKMEMHCLKRKSEEREKKYRIELTLLKNTLKETTEALEDCQLELQKSRNELRDLYKNRALLKANLDDAEYKLLRNVKLKESYLKLQEEKNVLEEKLADSQKIVSSLQRQITNLQNELHEPQKRQNLLKEELALEKQTNERLKQELHEESTRLKDQNLQMEKIVQQISVLNTQLNVVQTAHAELQHERETDRKQFQDIILSKDRSLSELRANEVQRAGQLYAAFNKYLSSIGSTPNL